LIWCEPPTTNPFRLAGRSTEIFVIVGKYILASGNDFPADFFTYRNEFAFITRTAAFGKPVHRIPQTFSSPSIILKM
jgi:hypothetical protein